METTITGTEAEVVAALRCVLNKAQLQAILPALGSSPGKIPAMAQYRAFDGGHVAFSFYKEMVVVAEFGPGMHLMFSAHVGKRGKLSDVQGQRAFMVNR